MCIIFTPVFYSGKILYFSLRKNQLFFCVKNSIFFCVEKSGIFAVHPGLDTGHWTGQRDSGTAGQRDSSGQWTVDRRTVLYGIMGHWTGHPVLDRRSPGALDNGRWTAGQWTGQSGQNLLSSSLLLCPPLIVLKWTDGIKNSSIKSIGYNGSVQPCRGFGTKSAGYVNGWTELRKTHIYII